MVFEEKNGVTEDQEIYFPSINGKDSHLKIFLLYQNNK